MTSRKHSRRSRDEDDEHEPPFTIQKTIHFKDCAQDELMLNPSERRKLQKVLLKLDVALEAVEDPDESSEEEPRQNKKVQNSLQKRENPRGNQKKQQPERKQDPEPMLPAFKKKEMVLKAKQGASESEPVASPAEESPEPKWTPSPLPEHEAAKLLKEKEAQEKLEIQALVDTLSTTKLATLVDMWKPQKDDKDEYVLDFESLSTEERVRFRKMVEQLVAEGPRETKPEEKANETQTSNASVPSGSKPSGSKPSGSKPSNPKGVPQNAKSMSKDAKPATSLMPEAPANPQAPEATPEVTTSSRPLTVQEAFERERQIEIDEMLAEIDTWM